MKYVKRFDVFEKLVLKDYSDYAKIIADKYDELPILNKSEIHHWTSLIESNNTLFKRLLSRVNVIFCTQDIDNVGSISILGKKYKIIFCENGQPYDNQPQMKQDYIDNNKIVISIDYSNHPIFTLEENIVFRTVHDFIVHIQGDYQFGLKGELQSYNLHQKLAPNDAVPALFTEVVGQVCWNYVNNGEFPVQKCAVIQGVDYVNIGVVEN